VLHLKIKADADNLEMIVCSNVSGSLLHGSFVKHFTFSKRKGNAPDT